MKKYIPFFLLIFTMTLSAQKKEITIPITGNFSEIKVYDKIHADLIPSDENKVVVTGLDKNKISAEVKNDKLKVQMSIDNLWKETDTNVKIYYNAADIIDGNEGSTLNLKGLIRQEKLKLRVQEGANISGQVNVKDLHIKAVSGGSIAITGRTTSQTVDVKTGGEYQGQELISENTKVTVTAGGSAAVNAKDYCGANVKAGGAIAVYGNPKTLDQKKVFGGKIIKK